MYSVKTPLGANSAGSNKNPFVETAVSFALAYASSSRDATSLALPVVLTILADDAYYSDSRTKKSPEDHFSNFGIPIETVHKTGLGSSAALVTSLVAATVLQVSPDSPLAMGLRQGSPPSVRKLHNLAQAAHCAAQGKVGSGFDVASAVYGSCKYRRFSPKILDGIGKPGDDGFGRQVAENVDETSSGIPTWDHEIDERVAVPKGIRMVMCDVDCGSQTPGMVKDVLKWRSSDPETADRLWAELQKHNDTLATELARLADGTREDYLTLRLCVEQIRRSIRLESKLANVPIEPPEQTALLDACSKVPGVIGGVVPGAGGYDAVVLLVEDDDEKVAGLAETLSEYKFSISGADFKGSSGKVSLLGVTGESEGLRVESGKSSIYSSWL